MVDARKPPVAEARTVTEYQKKLCAKFRQRAKVNEARRDDAVKRFEDIKAHPPRIVKQVPDRISAWQRRAALPATLPVMVTDAAQKQLEQLKSQNKIQRIKLVPRGGRIEVIGFRRSGTTKSLGTVVMEAFAGNANNDTRYGLRITKRGRGLSFKICYPRLDPVLSDQRTDVLTQLAEREAITKEL